MCQAPNSVTPNKTINWHCSNISCFRYPYRRNSGGHKTKEKVKFPPVNLTKTKNPWAIMLTIQLP